MNKTQATPKTLEDEILEANQKCAEWERQTFALGTAFTHCSKLESFAGPLLREALTTSVVRISMPSEYHAPRFRKVEA